MAFGEERRRAESSNNKETNSQAKTEWIHTTDATLLRKNRPALRLEL